MVITTFECFPDLLRPSEKFHEISLKTAHWRQEWSPKWPSNSESFKFTEFHAVYSGGNSLHPTPVELIIIIQQNLNLRVRKHKSISESLIRWANPSPIPGFWSHVLNCSGILFIGWFWEFTISCRTTPQSQAGALTGFVASHSTIFMSLTASEWWGIFHYQWIPWWCVYCHVAVGLVFALKWIPGLRWCWSWML